MKDVSVDMRRAGRANLWLSLLITSGVLLVVAANAHLIYIASVSQPPCVAHLRQGEGSGQLGLFSAADSSCSSTPRARAGAHPEGSEP